MENCWNKEAERPFEINARTVIAIVKPLLLLVRGDIYLRGYLPKLTQPHFVPIRRGGEGKGKIMIQKGRPKKIVLTREKSRPN